MALFIPVLKQTALPATSLFLCEMHQMYSSSLYAAGWVDRPGSVLNLRSSGPFTNPLLQLHPTCIQNQNLILQPRTTPSTHLPKLISAAVIIHLGIACVKC